MSRAILNVTQNKIQMDTIQSKYFGNQLALEDQSAKISSEGPSLGVYSFGGLFIIAGVVSMLSLLMYMYHFLCSHWSALRTICSSESTLREKVVEIAKHFDKKDALDTPDEGLGAPLGSNAMENDSTRTNVTVKNNLDVNENERTN